MSMRTLIVEDSVFTREILKMACREFGFAVVAEAKDGDEALAFVEQMRPELLLLDLVLPNRNGIEVAIEVRKTFPETKILAMSSLEKKFVLDKVVLDGFLEKPFTKKELFEHFQNLRTLNGKVIYG